MADPGSFAAWSEDVRSNDPYAFADLQPYRERLRAAEARTGVSEAVVTGRATVGGRPLGLIAAEFGFLGGSIGVATGERLARLLERCEAERLPVLALPASGGTRMQEGVVALMQMAKVAAAAHRFRRAGLAYLVYLTHPTTGGVLASWGSLGAVTWAMPEALVGFGGPRVVELMTGRALPEGIQVAEHLYERGLVDDVVVPGELRERVAAVLEVVRPTERPPVAGGREARGKQALPRAPLHPGAGDAWASLAHARNPARPSAWDLLVNGADHLTLLRGDGTGRGDDPSCRVALARFGGVPAVVVAQHRDAGAHGPSRMGPVGFGKARRGMALAGELGLALLTVIDTPGAEMSVAAEEGGVSAEIARCLADMSAVPTPTLCLLLGEGGSGGALALLPADRVVCAQHACLQPIAPEGASAILYRTTDRAAELADSQGIASWELERFGIVDRVVPEERPAHEDPRAFLERVAGAVADELRALAARHAGERLAARERRYRQVGNPAGDGSR